MAQGNGASNVVAAFSMMHTPALGDRMGEVPDDQRARILEGFAVASQQLAEARPDVIVIFINDHWDQFTMRNMAGFAIAYGDEHWGPRPDVEKWMQMKRAPIPGDTDLAQALIEGVTEDGVELFRFPSAEVGHNVLMPKKYLWPDTDIPVVPIYINCFGPPLPTWRRSYELGKAVRRVVDQRSQRVAFIASGGLSHWPPLSTYGLEKDDPLYKPLETLMTWGGREAFSKDPNLGKALHERMKQIEMLVDYDWDRDIIKRFEKADVEYLTSITNAEAMKAAGSGAPETMMWVALMGAMNDAKGECIMYEAVEPWRAAAALMTYAKSISEGA